MTQLLDGPLGSELLNRGVLTPLPGWSAHALDEAPAVVREIHRDYAIAGARIHTTNTFRTCARVFPTRWRELAERAVHIAREAVPADHRLAGSIAPLEDCYRPDLSPANNDPEGTRAEHAELAATLAGAGCDLLLCETFPHVAEGLLALEAALATGRETWISFTPGPQCNLLSPAEVAAAGRVAARLGAGAVLVNCVPALRTLEYLRELRQAVDTSVPVGCYANAGHIDDALGWSSDPGAPTRYAELAAKWIDAGADIVGGCCGTGPAHVQALAELLKSRDSDS